MQIALKEANETGYWLELLYKTNYIKVLAKIAKLEKEKKADRDEEIRRLIKINSDLNEKCDKLMRQSDQYLMLILD